MKEIYDIKEFAKKMNKPFYVKYVEDSQEAICIVRYYSEKREEPWIEIKVVKHLDISHKHLPTIVRAVWLSESDEVLEKFDVFLLNKKELFVYML